MGLYGGLQISPGIGYRASVGSAYPTIGGMGYAGAYGGYNIYEGANAGVYNTNIGLGGLNTAGVHSNQYGSIQYNYNSNGMSSSFLSQPIGGMGLPQMPQLRLNNGLNLGGLPMGGLSMGGCFPQPQQQQRTINIPFFGGSFPMPTPSNMQIAPMPFPISSPMPFCVCGLT
ncbi:MAG: hypothetical protein SFZ03_04215 [Candidatus Melainabacteria bacterium]|nr:hypothetical protein [Candidatus Melainabacteria bacterium]